MSRFRAVSYLLTFVLLLTALGGLVGEQAVLAAEKSSRNLPLPPPNQPVERLEITSLYPVLRDISGASFTFEVDLRWYGSAPRRFDLVATAPPRWRAVVLRAAEDREAPAIELDPAKGYADSVRVLLIPLAGQRPEVGEYVVKMEASSGSIKQAIELKAIVTAQYLFAFYTSTERLSAEVTAGEENHLSLFVENTGTAAIDKITFVSEKPQGWDITFTPEEVTALAPGLAQQVDVVIKPPSKTIAGDYAVTMRAIATQPNVSSRELALRITTLTPTIWGWVGVLIVLAVIAGVGVIFWRLGRR